MAKNPPSGDGHRHGQVTDRSQAYNPHNDRWVKRDADTGRFIAQKGEMNPPHTPSHFHWNILPKKRVVLIK